MASKFQFKSLLIFIRYNNLVSVNAYVLNLLKVKAGKTLRYSGDIIDNFKQICF